MSRLGRSHNRGNKENKEKQNQNREISTAGASRTWKTHDEQGKGSRVEEARTFGFTCFVIIFFVLAGPAACFPLNWVGFSLFSLFSLLFLFWSNLSLLLAPSLLVPCPRLLRKNILFRVLVRPMRPISPNAYLLLRVRSVRVSSCSYHNQSELLRELGCGGGEGSRGATTGKARKTRKSRTETRKSAQREHPEHGKHMTDKEKGAGGRRTFSSPCFVIIFLVLIGLALSFPWFG